MWGDGSDVDLSVMVFGVLIVLLVSADAARRQITGKTQP